MKQIEKNFLYRSIPLPSGYPAGTLQAAIPRMNMMNPQHLKWMEILYQKACMADFVYAARRDTIGRPIDDSDVSAARDRVSGGIRGSAVGAPHRDILVAHIDGRIIPLISRARVPAGGAGGCHVHRRSLEGVCRQKGVAERSGAAAQPQTDPRGACAVWDDDLAAGWRIENDYRIRLYDYVYDSLMRPHNQHRCSKVLIRRSYRSSFCDTFPSASSPASPSYPYHRDTDRTSHSARAADCEPLSYGTRCIACACTAAPVSTRGSRTCRSSRSTTPPVASARAHRMGVLQ